MSTLCKLCAKWNVKISTVEWNVKISTAICKSCNLREPIFKAQTSWESFTHPHYHGRHRRRGLRWGIAARTAWTLRRGQSRARAGCPSSMPIRSRSSARESPVCKIVRSLNNWCFEFLLKIEDQSDLTYRSTHQVVAKLSIQGRYVFYIGPDNLMSHPVVILFNSCLQGTPRQPHV